MAFCSACSGSDSSEVVIKSEPNEGEEDGTNAGMGEDSEDGASDAGAEEASTSDENEFVYFILEENESKTVDIGNDGKKDTLLLECDKNHNCSLKINDTTTDIITDNHEDEFGRYKYVIFCYIHKSDGDYMLSKYYLTSGWGVGLYKVQDDTIKEIDKIEQAGFYCYDGDVAPGYEKYKISSNTVAVNKGVELFGSTDFIRNYTYGENGFAPAEDMCRISYRFYESENVHSGLVLKKPMTFCDKYGKELNKLEAGEKVYHYEGNNPLEDKDNVQMIDNKIGFIDKDGKFLGYITYNLKETDIYYEVDIDGQKEDEVFDGIFYGDL